MSPEKRRDIVGLVSFGLFLVLVGIIIAITPDWYAAARSFIEDFELEKVNGNIYLPAPAEPYDHKVVYTAVEQFCLAWGIFQIGILVLRFFLGQTVHKKAETFSGIIFWLCTAYATSLLLAESLSWFGLWAVILIIIGLAIVARSLVVLLYELMR